MSQSNESYDIDKAGAKQSLQQSPDIDPYEVPESLKAGSSIDLYGKSYGGLRRLPYFLIPFIASIAFLILGILTPIILKTGRITSLPIFVGFYLFFIVLSLYVVLARFKNIGMTRWWIFALLVPLLNIWVTIWLMSRQEGWVETRQLDSAGKIISIIMWLPIILYIIFIIVAFGFMAYYT